MVEDVVLKSTFVLSAYPVQRDRLGWFVDDKEI